MKKIKLTFNLLLGVILSAFLWTCMVGLFYGQSKVFFIDKDYALIGWPGMLAKYDNQLGVYAPIRVFWFSVNWTNPRYS